MERNQNGYPVEKPQNTGSPECEGDTLSGLPLAYAYVPIQAWRMLYSPDVALDRGTLFEELDKPMEAYGNE